MCICALSGACLIFAKMRLMVTEQEKLFVEWWRKNRDREKRLFRQWLIGLPVGLVFALPIVLNFVSGWNKRATMWAQGHTDDDTAGVLAVAALIIVSFVAVFYKRHKWEMYEQQYLEILSKMRDNDGITHGEEGVN
jgi:hypothetical protein